MILTPVRIVSNNSGEHPTVLECIDQEGKRVAVTERCGVLIACDCGKHKRLFELGDGRLTDAELPNYHPLPGEKCD